MKFKIWLKLHWIKFYLKLLTDEQLAILNKHQIEEAEKSRRKN